MAPDPPALRGQVTDDTGSAAPSGQQCSSVYEQPPHDADPQHPNARLLLWAYRHGAFPMADPDSGSLEWFSPNPRGIIPLDAFRVPKNLAREVRRRRFEIRYDTAFRDVMTSCGPQRPAPEGSWIDERLLAAYGSLHEIGHAHSVEAWREGRLVGGLYGVHLGAAFFGESMFVRPELGGTNASKVCLVHLVERLIERNFRLLDTQLWNPHLDQFGCIEIPRREYLRRLEDAVAGAGEVGWGP